MLIVLVAVVTTYVVLAVVAACSSGWIDAVIEIDAPVAAVWDYGSDSERARDWSVYFSHIKPITGPDMPEDGTVGALRICYRNSDETGIRWDETTEQITLHRHREIRTFNLVGFPFGPLGRAQEYEVHQYYEAIDEQRSRLQFRSNVVRRSGLLALLSWPLVKLAYVVFGAPAGQQTFEWNLENIKAAIEAEQQEIAYVRPNPYAVKLPWERTPLRWWFDYRLQAIRA